jgi:DNA repair exonuclease SbcCD ATPase subunit
MNNTQYEVLLAEVRSLKQKVDDIDLAEEKDREQFQNQNVNLENLKTEVAELRRAVNANPERIKNTVADVVEPVVGALQDQKGATEGLTSQIKKSKTVIFGESKKSFWDKLLRR